MKTTALALGIVAVGTSLAVAGCGSTSPVSGVPTEAQLQRAVLAVGDLPSGYNQVSPGTTPTTTVNSTSTACSTLGRLITAKTMPGSLREVDRRFSNAGNQEIDVALSAFKTPTAAAALVNQVATAAAQCPRLVLTQNGYKATLDIVVAGRPQLGSDAVAVRITDSDPTSGIAGTNALVVVGSTVVGVGGQMSTGQALALAKIATEKFSSVMGS